jgi:hypothetical protein
VGGGVRVHLHPTTNVNEYDMVVAQLVRTLGDAEVVQVERVQASTRRELTNVVLNEALRTAPENPGVRWLWHGANKAEALDSIVNNGFDPMLSGTRTGELFGRGIYFARDASYSNTYASPGPSVASRQTKQLLLVGVVVGRTCLHTADEPQVRE